MPSPTAPSASAAAEQPALFEFRMGERSPATLAVSRANEAAALLLQDWRSWPGGALALAGPAGSGKTHLALAWALEAGARAVEAAAEPDAAARVFQESGGRVWIDDADGARNDAMLWRLLDLSRKQRGAVLLVGAAPPAAWSTPIKDLRSRLVSLPVAQLGEPDEALLELVLRRLCRERFIELREDGAKFLAQRMPRTFAAARDVAGALEALMVRRSRPATAAQARRALEAAERAWRNAASGGVEEQS